MNTMDKVACKHDLLNAIYGRAFNHITSNYEKIMIKSLKDTEKFSSYKDHVFYLTKNLFCVRGVFTDTVTYKDNAIKIRDPLLHYELKQVNKERNIIRNEMDDINAYLTTIIRSSKSLEEFKKYLPERYHHIINKYNLYEVFEGHVEEQPYLLELSKKYNPVLKKRELLTLVLKD